MKALTIIEPWATLIAKGYKHYETRHWSTPYRGPIAIHAGKKRLNPETDWPYMVATPARLELGHAAAIKLDPDKLHYGCVIAVANLVRVISTNRMPAFSPFEQSVGDFSPGRYAWQMREVLLLPEAIPTRGYQGIWDWNPPAEVRVWLQEQGRMAA